MSTSAAGLRHHRDSHHIEKHSTLPRLRRSPEHDWDAIISGAVLNKRFSNSGRRLDRFSTGQSDDMELQAAELWAERGFMPQKPPTIHPAQKKIADLRYSYRAAAYTAQEYSKAQIARMHAHKKHGDFAVPPSAWSGLYGDTIDSSDCNSDNDATATTTTTTTTPTSASLHPGITRASSTATTSAAASRMRSSPLQLEIPSRYGGPAVLAKASSEMGAIATRSKYNNDNNDANSAYCAGSRRRTRASNSTADGSGESASSTVSNNRHDRRTQPSLRARERRSSIAGSVPSPPPVSDETWIFSPRTGMLGRRKSITHAAALGSTAGFSPQQGSATFTTAREPRRSSIATPFVGIGQDSEHVYNSSDYDDDNDSGNDNSYMHADTATDFNYHNDDENGHGNVQVPGSTGNTGDVNPTVNPLGHPSPTPDFISVRRSSRMAAAESAHARLNSYHAHGGAATTDDTIAYTPNENAVADDPAQLSSASSQSGRNVPPSTTTVRASIPAPPHSLNDHKPKPAHLGARSRARPSTAPALRTRARANHAKTAATSPKKTKEKRKRRRPTTAAATVKPRQVEPPDGNDRLAQWCMWSLLHEDFSSKVKKLQAPPGTVARFNGLTIAPPPRLPKRTHITAQSIVHRRSKQLQDEHEHKREHADDGNIVIVESDGSTTVGSGLSNYSTDNDGTDVDGSSDDDGCYTAIAGGSFCKSSSTTNDDRYTTSAASFTCIDSDTEFEDANGWKADDSIGANEAEARLHNRNAEHDEKATVDAYNDDSISSACDDDVIIPVGSAGTASTAVTTPVVRNLSNSPQAVTTPVVRNRSNSPPTPAAAEESSNCKGRKEHFPTPYFIRAAAVASNCNAFEGNHADISRGESTEWFDDGLDVENVRDVIEEEDAWGAPSELPFGSTIASSSSISQPQSMLKPGANYNDADAENGVKDPVLCSNPDTLPRRGPTHVNITTSLLSALEDELEWHEHSHGDIATGACTLRGGPLLHPHTHDHTHGYVPEETHHNDMVGGATSPPLTFPAGADDGDGTIAHTCTNNDSRDAIKELEPRPTVSRSNRAVALSKAASTREASATSAASAAALQALPAAAAAARAPRSVLGSGSSYLTNLKARVVGSAAAKAAASMTRGDSAGTAGTAMRLCKEEEAAALEAARLAEVEASDGVSTAPLAHDVAKYYLVGLAHELGRGIQQPNSAEAAKWFARAAKHGHPNAQHSLAGAYWAGAGVEKDRAKSAEIHRRLTGSTVTASAAATTTGAKSASILLDHGGKDFDAQSVANSEATLSNNEQYEPWPLPPEIVVLEDDVQDPEEL